MHNFIKCFSLKFVYTAGTLIVAVGGGSLAGYPVFLWAEKWNL